MSKKDDQEQPEPLQAPAGPVPPEQVDSAEAKATEKPAWTADIRDGGDPTLRLGHKPLDGAVAVYDRTTLEPVDPDLYEVQAQSVRRRDGVWPGAADRWQVEYRR